MASHDLRVEFLNASHHPMNWALFMCRERSQVDADDAVLRWGKQRRRLTMDSLR
jgi:hypothetical protein